MKIKIDRAGAIPTKLFVNVVSKEGKENLGVNRPVAFILPGGPGADHHVYQAYNQLKDIVDIVFHDPRGCGQSDRDNPKYYTMDNYIDDIEEIRQKLGLNKIIVIGKSYGSMCALGYTLRYPGSVQKLILVAGAPSYRFLATAKKNLARLGTPQQIKICEKLWQGNFKNNDDLLTFFQLTNSLYSVKARHEPATFDLKKKNNQFSYEVLNEGFRNSFWHFDYEHDLHRITCPTLLLAGRDDWINDVKHAEFMVARIPHSQLRVFEGASHALEADVPDIFFQTVTDFISR